MAKNFHESFGRAEVQPPSERGTGFVFAAAALIIAILWRNSAVVPWVAFGLAVTLAAVSLIEPTLLRPINLLWFRFGLLLHKIVSPIVLFAMFAVVFVPAGFMMRLWRDPLRSRRATDESSYWIDRGENGNTAVSMTNTF